MDKIHAPFTPEQVAALNEHQCNPRVHPYTCPFRGDAALQHYPEGKLIATPEGWMCPSCTYRQNWSHDPQAWRAE